MTWNIKETIKNSKHTKLNVTSGASFCWPCC